MWIDTGRARVRIDGPVALATGSRVDLRAGEAALVDGDEVVAVGVRSEALVDADEDRSTGYRETAGARVLAAPAGTSMRIASVTAPRPSGLWRRLLPHPGMWPGYILFGVFAAYLIHARSDADLQGYCQFYGQCGVAPTPPREWLERGPFRAVADSDEACRSTVLCTGRGPPVKQSPTEVVRGVLNPPDRSRGEGCQAPCALVGACADRGDACGPGSAADCALTEGCVLWGYCSATDRGCVPLRDEDCADSRACRLLGRCRAIAGTCRNPEHLDLAADDAGLAFGRGSNEDRRSLREKIGRCYPAPCKLDGRCDANDDGECVVGSDEDCTRSSACQAGGACRRWSDGLRAECAASCADTRACKEAGRCAELAPGLCGVPTDEACRRSEACRQDGRCTLVDGTCQATAAVCASWDGCAFDGRCTVVEGACRITAEACARTIPCAKLGACSPSPYWEGCAVGSDPDCAKSEVCKRYGWCDGLSLGYLPTAFPSTTSSLFCFDRRLADRR